MKHTSKILIAGTCLAFIGFLFWKFQIPPAHTVPPIESTEKPKNSIKSAGGQDHVHSATQSLQYPQVELIKTSKIDPELSLIHILATNNKLNLTIDEINKIQSVYERMLEKRYAIELSLAEKETISPQRTLISIPSYVDQGKALYDEFISSVASITSPETGNRFAQTYNNDLMILNKGFGQKPQNILVDRSSDVFVISHEFSTLITSDSGPISINKTFGSTLNKKTLLGYEYLRGIIE